MSSSKNQSNSTSNRNGESVGRAANVLASAYCVDSSARLSGFRKYHDPYTAIAHPSLGIPEVRAWNSGLPSPPSSPPLAALTSANELALISKSTRSRDNDTHGRATQSKRLEGATYHIRGECERLFCETMKDVFFGEGGSSSSNGSFGMNTYNMNNLQSTPPSEDQNHGYFTGHGQGQDIDAWIEVWDYAGGCSFRVFVGGNGENKSLFAFFDSAVIGRDLKQGLMALIELAETVFAVSQVVVCVDRSVQEVNRKAFLKSLRWVGFEAVTLDLWAGRLDITSDKWLFLGMEV
ncbi:hypothetical protein HYALB_00003816 [Hymenoscyphus albidus]|uniref:Ornithine decarboxylase antizyme n=1 Tax=Hymenoscyphus albidus TaxID=595503 RepID=A0A9N9QAZ5_9HELO|nr:hypothetical protein HYALB_00003816 [Hymenoscyphus albidus]